MQSLNIDDLQLVVRRMPKDVQDALRSNAGTLFVGGGFIRSVVGNEEVNDIDFFGPSQGSLDRVATSFHRSDFRRDARRLNTKNAITLAQPGRTTLQFIHRWTYSDPADVVASFDFTVCQAVIRFDGSLFRSLIGPNFYSDLAAKRLRYTRPVREEEAGGSMLRVMKYTKRGYRIQMAELAAVMARVIAHYDHGRGHVGVEQFIQARMQEVDPLSVIDGVPVDDDVPVKGLGNEPAG